LRLHAEDVTVSRQVVAGDTLRIETVPTNGIIMSMNASPVFAWRSLELEAILSTSTYSGQSSVATTRDAMSVPGSGAHIHRRISWAAVAGGVVLVVVLQLLLSLLGAGVGLGTVNTNAGSTPMASTLGGRI
jgi:hypothetical protein